MKLALCLFKYARYGGLRTDFRRIFDLCQQRGHSLTVYTLDWQGEQPKDCTIHRVNVSARSNHARAWQFSRAVAKQCQQHRYDCVIGFNRMPGLDVYFAADVCFAWQLAQRPGAGYLNYLPRYATYLRLERTMLAEDNTPHCLFLSRLQQSGYQDHYSIPPEKNHLLPPGLAPTWHYPDNATQLREQTRTTLGLTPNDHLLLTVGSHFKTKGVARSLQAIGALPKSILAKTHFAVIGDDDPHRYLRMAKHYGITPHIHFLGGQSNIQPFMLAADLLLHPARFESAGLVILEALASRLPVITTADCGHAWHIQQAQAGMVLASPFCQHAYNAALHTALSTECLSDWQQDAVTYTQQTPLYGLHEQSVTLIESIDKQ